MDKILTVNDVAAILQVKAITVREMFREKRLRGFKVGKAWRTTEAMLGEDIDSLARGEVPANLPSSAPQNTAAPATTTPPSMTSEKRVQPKTINVAETPAEPAPQRANVEIPTPKDIEKKAPATDDQSTSEADEDTQQLLF